MKPHRSEHVYLLMSLIGMKQEQATIEYVWDKYPYKTVALLNYRH